MKGIGKTIIDIKAGSIAESLGIRRGDVLLSINGEPVGDILDYLFLTQSGSVDLLIRKQTGEEWLYEIEKDEDEDPGLVFGSGLTDSYKRCANKCIFCFIDQLPKGMRETLYFKDDDSRLSFLQGNYVTLTNMSDADLDRIIRYRLSPINISFHTADPALRCRMLGNRHAGDIMKKADRLAHAGIRMNGQIVLCSGVNDREELDRTLNALTGLVPSLMSVAVVPVGITRYRDGLYPLSPLTREDARRALSQIEAFQIQMLRSTGTRFVYAADELYLLAGEPIPEEKAYDGYPQLENGVGMMRLLEEEIRDYLRDAVPVGASGRVSIVTGTLAADFIKRMSGLVREKEPGLEVAVYGVRNEFFGETITVSGLLTGGDIIRALRNEPLGERLLLPINMLRAGERVFLDDMTVENVEEELGVRVVVTDQDGASFCQALTGAEDSGKHSWRQIYEQTDRGDCRQTECR